jgi:hypothetical protein
MATFPNLAVPHQNRCASPIEGASRFFSRGSTCDHKRRQWAPILLYVSTLFLLTPRCDESRNYTVSVFAVVCAFRLLYLRLAFCLSLVSSLAIPVPDTVYAGLDVMVKAFVTVSVPSCPCVSCVGALAFVPFAVGTTTRPDCCAQWWVSLLPRYYSMIV